MTNRKIKEWLADYRIVCDEERDQARKLEQDLHIAPAQALDVARSLVESVPIIYDETDEGEEWKE